MAARVEQGEAPSLLGAASGAIAVALFVAGATAVGDLPDFDASGSEIAAHVGEHRTGIQIGAALDAAAIPFLIWFLATIAGVARTSGPAPRRAAAIAFGCGVAYVAVFAVDIATLAVSALHPENLADAPELARALRDFEWIAIGTATPLGVAMLAALGALPLRHAAVWPRWIGWLAVGAAAAYAFRIGTLFTDSGAFAADGVLGLILPVGAILAWVLAASASLAIGARGGA